MNTPREPGLTVLIPCLNEERSIAHCVREALAALRENAIPGEVVVVDNGSTDGSAAAAAEAGARVVHEPRRGYGRAYVAGVRAARFAYCLKGDADGSYDFREIPLFWRELQKGDCDVVLGSRFAGTIQPGAMPFLHRYFGTPALTTLVNLIYRARLSDVNSGMRAFPAAKLLDLRPVCPGMEFASEMLVKSLKKGHVIREIPITLRKDLRQGKPHLRSFRDGWRHLRFIVQMSPFQLFLYPGILCVLGGLAGSGFLLARAVGLDRPGAAPAALGPVFGLTTFACLQSFILLGVVLVLFSLMSKTRLVQAGIDFPGRLVPWLAGGLAGNGFLLWLAAAGALNLAWSAQIILQLLAHLRAGLFSPLYTQLGMLNCTAHVALLMLFFSSFFTSGIGIEDQPPSAGPA